MRIKVTGINRVSFTWAFDGSDAKFAIPKIERDYKLDMTGFVIMCIDVWYGKGSNSSYLTRCGVEVPDFRIMQWSKNLRPIHDGAGDNTTLDTTIRNWDPKTRRDIEVEFMEVNFSDINDMINWLRNQKNVFYTPPKDEKYEWVPKAEFEHLKKEHKKKVDAQQKELRKYQDFFDSVCDELDMPESDPEKVLEELSDDLERLDSLEDFRYEICDILDMDGLPGTPRQTDRLVIERVRKLSQERDSLSEFKRLLTDLIQLPEDKKETATTKDYISAFKYTKTQWLKMVEERQKLKLCNEALQESNKSLQAQVDEQKGHVYELSQEYDNFGKKLEDIYDVSGCEPRDFDDPLELLMERLERRVEELNRIEHEHYHITQNWVREDHLEEVLNELCDKHSVVRPCDARRDYKDRLDYIFDVLVNWRKRAVRAEHEYDECVKANTKDYANAKAARAELANLYKRILGEERLDPKLSPHEIAVAIIKHVQGLCDLQHEANMGVKELQKFRDEVYNALNLGYPTTNQYILKVLKERLAANDFYVEGADAAEYRAFVMRLFEAIGKPTVEEIVSTQYLAKVVLEDVKELKRQNDRGITYVRRMRELEQKLEDIKNICDGNSDVLNIIGELDEEE